MPYRDPDDALVVTFEVHAIPTKRKPWRPAG